MVKDPNQYCSPYVLKSLKSEFNKLHSNKLSQDDKRYIKQLIIRCCKTAILLDTEVNKCFSIFMCQTNE